jgi:predicted CXXCH cytochrome family protein
MPGELKSVADKLCSGCHVDKTALRAISDRLWLHNPTAKGECLACHDPHQSKFSGVLRKPAEQICQSCHSSASLAALPLHPVDGRPCLECHNPHMGRDRILLRKEYQEQKQPVDGRPQAR